MTAGSPYDIDLLIEQTRQLAADYRSSTGKALPVGAEIALHDAARLLNLVEPAEPVAGIDLQSPDQSVRYQLKSRAIFAASKSTPRLGTINKNGDWTDVLLVLMNDSYETTHLYALDKARVIEELQGNKSAMTVAKFKVLGECVWSREESLTA